METEKISMTYKNDFQSMYEANYVYALWKGNLSKKHTAKIFLPVTAIIIIIMFINIIEKKENVNAQTVVFLLLTIAVFSLSAFFISRAINKSAIKNYCKTMFEQGIDSKSTQRVEFDNEKMTVQTNYSLMSVPYNEIDFVISDRINFIYTIGSEARVRNIPKINQNPDVLFAADNLLREKLGNRFIYKM